MRSHVLQNLPTTLGGVCSIHCMHTVQYNGSILWSPDSGHTMYGTQISPKLPQASMWHLLSNTTMMSNISMMLLIFVDHKKIAT